MYICAMLARTFSFSRGLVFLLRSPQFSLRKFSRYADRFCGNPQRRSASAFPVHIPPCYHFGAILYQFFEKDRLSGQIAIRSFSRRTIHRTRYQFSPFHYHFRHGQYQNRAKRYPHRGRHSSRREGAVKNARYCCHLTAELPQSDSTLIDAHFPSETVTAFWSDSDATRCQIPRILTAHLRDTALAPEKNT